MTKEMEKRSSRRIRTLMARSAGRGMYAYQIGCARISMMARSSELLQSEAGYISARPLILILTIPLLRRAAGPYIRARSEHDRPVKSLTTQARSPVVLLRLVASLNSGFTGSR